MPVKTDQITKILQLKGLGRKTAFKICEKAGDEIIDNDKDLMEFLFGCIANKWIPRLPEYSKNELIDAFNKGEDILEKSENINIKTVSYYDISYPQALKNIKDPPIILNFKGDYKQLNDLTGVAIIGTREPTYEGIRSGEFFGEYFGKHGYNVVSGLAKGCDSAAHRGCLKSGGVTTAILAHGLDTIYPKENFELAEDIVDKGGILLSEYFIKVGALASYFVERDRLQAGLSDATIVVQTAEKGGTMHAVKATIESDKLLAAIQYKEDFYSEKILGNKLLIVNKSAFPLTSKNVGEFLKKLSEGKEEQTNLISNHSPLSNKPTQGKLF